MPEEMDVAAEQAMQELRPNLDKWSARDLMVWWKNWYMKAGHKRLGRLLVKLSENKGSLWEEGGSGDGGDSEPTSEA